MHWTMWVAVGVITLAIVLALLGGYINRRERKRAEERLSARSYESWGRRRFDEEYPATFTGIDMAEPTQADKIRQNILDRQRREQEKERQRMLQQGPVPSTNDAAMFMMLHNPQPMPASHAHAAPIHESSHSSSSGSSDSGGGGSGGGGGGGGGGGE